MRAVAENRASYVTVRKEMSREDMFKVTKDLELQMKASAKNLEFEKAAMLRDEIYELRRLLALGEKEHVPLPGRVPEGASPLFLPPGNL